MSVRLGPVFTMTHRVSAPDTCRYYAMTLATFCHHSQRVYNRAYFLNKIYQSKNHGLRFTLLTQTQDPMALEMAAFRDDSPPMSKENFGIITTTQDGILNTPQIMNNEIANHTNIILKKI